MILAMLPYLLILTVFTGGMYLAIDATAGERERQSLEPLLINPVSRAALMGGKFLASAAFGMVSLALGLTAFRPTASASRSTWGRPSVCACSR